MVSVLLNWTWDMLDSDGERGGGAGRVRLAESLAAAESAWNPARKSPTLKLGTDLECMRPAGLRLCNFLGLLVVKGDGDGVCEGQSSVFVLEIGFP